jgi:hypothetical protein
MPSGLNVVMRAPGRPRQPQRLTAQVKAFRKEGLL